MLLCARRREKARKRGRDGVVYKRRESAYIYAMHARDCAAAARRTRLTSSARAGFCHVPCVCVCEYVLQVDVRARERRFFREKPRR